MPKRTIKIGLASYLNADGLEQFGLFGAEVDVHPDDVERFDRLNGSEVAAGPVEEPEVSGPEEPPRAGRGSGLEAWSDYATALGLNVPEDATRDDVIELVDARSE